jgi:heavy metal-binding protein
MTLSRHSRFAAGNPGALRATLIDVDQQPSGQNGHTYPVWPLDQCADMAPVYLCPMHSEIRQPTPGKCTRCGMALVPEGTRFGLLRHMVSSPLHLAMMGVLMVVVMVIGMMLMK